MAKEISDQLAAAEHQHHAVSVLLEFGHSLGNRVLDQGGIVPVQLFQGAGCHELRHGIELGCEGIILGGKGPMRGEDLVGLAAEEQALGLLIPAAEQRAHVVVPVVHHPAAVSEPAAPVLLRAAGTLHDAIDAEEIRYHEGPHDRTSLRESLSQGRQAGSARTQRGVRPATAGSRHESRPVPARRMRSSHSAETQRYCPACHGSRAPLASRSSWCRAPFPLPRNRWSGPPPRPSTATTPNSLRPTESARPSWAGRCARPSSSAPESAPRFTWAGLPITAPARTSSSPR